MTELMKTMFIISEDGTIRSPEGNLSGSNLRFNDGVYNAINKARLPFVTVINASTINLLVI